MPFSLIIHFNGPKRLIHWYSSLQQQSRHTLSFQCTGCLGFGSIQPKLYVITFVRVVYEFKFWNFTQSRAFVCTQNAKSLLTKLAINHFLMPRWLSIQFWIVIFISHRRPPANSFRFDVILWTNMRKKLLSFPVSHLSRWVRWKELHLLVATVDWRGL